MILNVNLSKTVRSITVVALTSLCFGLGIAGPAYGDVIEIGPTGIATVYAGPTLFMGTSARPIKAPEVPSPAAPARLERMAANPLYPKVMHPVLASYVDEAASKYGVDPALVLAVAWQESRFRDAARSHKGAIGVMQLMPATASMMGVDPYDSRQNIHGGVAYLRAMLTQFDGDVRLALAAYNAGPAAVVRYRGVPPFRETQNYVKAIVDRLSIR
jgi:soluble lytic murein transglycosylase-like protein